MATPEQGFPSVDSSFVMSTGGPNTPPDKITPPWYRLLLTLWNRTGGSSGTPGPLVGEIKAYGSATVPDGYLPCDGAAVSRTTYAALFASISTTWGIGDGTTTFNVPDGRGRSLVGSNGVINVGDSGGAATAAIGVPNLPAHSHGVTDPQHTHAFTGTAHTHAFTGTAHGHGVTDPGHVHGAPRAVLATTTGPGAELGVIIDNTDSAVTGVTIQNTTAGGSNANTTAAGTNAAAATGITTQDTGAGTALPIRNPYAGVLYIIKT